MRRLGTATADGERGAISVLVAILMVTLLGFTALAVDVGMLYAERTQLRNGADAAALAIAQKCARNINDADCSTTSALARSLANSNAGDGASNITALVLDKAAGTVKVTAGAQEAGQGAQPGFPLLRPRPGDQRRRGHRRRHRAVGPSGGGPDAVPPRPSPSARSKTTSTASLQLLQSHGDNANPDCMYGPVRSRRSGRLRLAHQQPGRVRRHHQHQRPETPANSRQQLPRRLRQRPAEVGGRHHRRQGRHCPAPGLQRGDRHRHRRHLQAHLLCRLQGQGLEASAADNELPDSFHNKPPAVSVRR